MRKTKEIQRSVVLNWNSFYLVFSVISVILWRMVNKKENEERIYLERLFETCLLTPANGSEPNSVKLFSKVQFCRKHCYIKNNSGRKSTVLMIGNAFYADHHKFWGECERIPYGASIASGWVFIMCCLSLQVKRFTFSD